MMSHIVPVDCPEAVEYAVEVLRVGGLIVVPTDTVYGLGAKLDETAIDRIFVLKQRPSDRAVPVLLADIEDVSLVARVFPTTARWLAEAFWPGPLTLALPKRDDLPPNLTHLPTVAVRVPAHDRTRAILAAAGGAVAVTSANRSNQPPALTVHAAIDTLLDAVALYLDGGPCAGGLPSTVVGFEGEEWFIMRPGPLSETELRAALRPV